MHDQELPVGSLDPNQGGVWDLAGGFVDHNSGHPISVNQVQLLADPEPIGSGFCHATPSICAAFFGVA
jgi:hypothetical protein